MYGIAKNEIKSSLKSVYIIFVSKWFHQFEALCIISIIISHLRMHDVLLYLLVTVYAGLSSSGIVVAGFLIIVLTFSYTD